MTVLADHGAPLGVPTCRAINSAATERAGIPANSERIRRNGPCMLYGPGLHLRSSPNSLPQAGPTPAGCRQVTRNIHRHRGHPTVKGPPSAVPPVRSMLSWCYLAAGLRSYVSVLSGSFPLCPAPVPSKNSCSIALSLVRCSIHSSSLIGLSLMR